MWTRKGKTAYLHVFRWPGDRLVVPLVKTKVLSATILATGKQVRVRQEHNGRLVLSGLPKRPPHPAVTVIKIRFSSEPRLIDEKDKAAWLTGDA